MERLLKAILNNQAAIMSVLQDQADRPGEPMRSDVRRYLSIRVERTTAILDTLSPSIADLSR